MLQRGFLGGRRRFWDNFGFFISHSATCSYWIEERSGIQHWAVPTWIECGATQAAPLATQGADLATVLQNSENLLGCNVLNNNFYAYL